MKNINRRRAKKLIAKTIVTEHHCNIPQLKDEFPYYDYVEEIRIHFINGKLNGLNAYNKLQIEKDEFFDLKFDIAFKPIYIEYFIHTFKHVTNEYLETKLKDLGFKLNVIGEDEKTGQCPCCLYYSIDYGEDGLWDICSVCFWENGGEGPNHMTLEKAQQNFEKFGAINASSVKFVDPDGRIKYKKTYSN